MKIFTIDNETSVVCNYKKTRNGFKHEASLMIQGREAGRTKICYTNRTWEAYEYQSVLDKILEAHGLPKYDEAKGTEEDLRGLKAVAGLAMLADVLTDDTKQANALKKQALSSISGVIMPEDWDELPEDEKQRRLNGAIEAIQ